ncbi:MAG: hypothetical protein KME13_20420 [Myxacorys californica WJT36-NPBG1]|nr:hypothetical protein [Myxacorys californica WJT36-NPBG1]
MKWLPQENYGKQWAVAFGLGCFTWISSVCFVAYLAPPLRLLTMFIPLVFFLVAVTLLPKWQKEGRRNDLVDSLKEREWNSQVMGRHQVNMVAISVDYDQELKALADLYATPTPDEPASGRYSTPHAGLPIADQANSLLRIQQEVMQCCGDVGWALCEYLTGKGGQYCDSDGWISVEKLRSNWGKNFGLKTENIKQLLIAISNIGLGEWKDSSLKEWRLLLTV